MISALVLGGPANGTVLSFHDRIPGPDDVLNIAGAKYRVLDRPLWQGDRKIVGYGTVLLPIDEPPPNDAIARLYEAGCVRPAC